MQILNILWPTFLLVAVIFVVWATMIVRRLGHMKRNPPKAGDFADRAAMLRYFGDADTPANNLANLFEMPVLFFALVPLLIATQAAGPVQVLLAWAFVLLRGAHSAIHLGPNSVRARFAVYLLSSVLLAAMWIGFFVDALSAAAMVHQANAVIGAMPGPAS